MTNMLDLVQTMHDIDRVKGRCCGACEFFSWEMQETWKQHHCSRNHAPLGADDGCDDFQSRLDREARQLAAVVMSV